MVLADKEMHPAAVSDLAMVNSAADALGSLATQAMTLCVLYLGPIIPNLGLKSPSWQTA
jgi:hypothetical protein